MFEEGPPIFLAAFFYGREDIIPEMFRRLLGTLYNAKHNSNDSMRHFIYYIDRHIELDGDSHGPKGRELLDDLVAGSPQRASEFCAPRAAALRPGSDSGMAHCVSSATTVA